MKREIGNLDVLILGGGPAGLAAIQWCFELGLSCLLLEREGEPGGQLLRTYNRITNYLGAEASDGRELRDIFVQQLGDVAERCVRGAEIVTADLAHKVIATADGTVYSGRAVIIATGVRRAELGIPGEREFRGRGVLESGVKQHRDAAGKRVVIIGGGDAALENTLLLAANAEKVYVVHRRAAFSARPDFLRKASFAPNVEFILESVATSIDGRETVESIEIENVATGQHSTIASELVLIRIGVEPNTELFRGQIELDGAGYIVIDQTCGTNLPGVYAIGDVTNPTAPTIAAAVGQASIATKTIFDRLGND